MNKIIAVLLVPLAGCTLYSGPTVNAGPVGSTQNESKVFQVECTGLFEETGSCLTKAKELCAIQPGSPTPHVLEQIGPRGRTPDRLVVRCDAPVKPVVAPAPVQVPPPPLSPEKVLLHGDALFDFDKADLKPAGRQALDEVIRKTDGKHFRVVQVPGTLCLPRRLSNLSNACRVCRQISRTLKHNNQLSRRVRMRSGIESIAWQHRSVQVRSVWITFDKPYKRLRCRTRKTCLRTCHPGITSKSPASRPLSLTG